MALRDLVDELAERFKKASRAKSTASSKQKQPRIVQRVKTAAPKAVQSLKQFVTKYPSPASYVGAKVAPQVSRAKQFVQKYPSPATYVGKNLTPSIVRQFDPRRLSSATYQGVIKPSLPTMKKYTLDFIKSIPEAGKAIVKTSAPYQAYREMTNRPMSGLERLSEGLKVIKPLYLGAPGTPARETLFATLQAIRQGKQPKEITEAALKGTETRPGFGAVFTDDPKWQTAINLAFMGAMIAKPYLKVKLDRVIGSKPHLDEMSKTLDIPKNASLGQAESNWLGKVQQLMDRWSKEPQTPQLAFELNTQYARLGRAGEIFKGYNVLDRNFAVVLDYIGQQGGFIKFGSKVGGKPKPPTKPSKPSGETPPLVGMIGEGKVDPKFKIKLAQEKIAETQADIAQKFVQKPTERGVLGETPSIDLGKQATQISLGSQMPTPMDEFLKERPPVAVIKPTPAPVQPKVVAKIGPTVPQPSKIGEGGFSDIIKELETTYKTPKALENAIDNLGKKKNKFQLSMGGFVEAFDESAFLKTLLKNEKKLYRIGEDIFVDKQTLIKGVFPKQVAQQPSKVGEIGKELEVKKVSGAMMGKPGYAVFDKTGKSISPFFNTEKQAQNFYNSVVQQPIHDKGKIGVEIEQLPSGKWSFFTKIRGQKAPNILIETVKNKIGQTYDRFKIFDSKEEAQKLLTQAIKQQPKGAAKVQHQMPGGTTMAGLEHPGAIPGSTEEIPSPEEIETAQAGILEKAGKEVRKEKLTAGNYKGWDLRQFLNRMKASKEGTWTLPNTKEGISLRWDEVAEDLGYNVDGPTTEPKPGQIVNKAFYDDLVELKGGQPGAPVKRVAKVKSPQFQKTAEFFEVDKKGVVKRTDPITKEGAPPVAPTPPPGLKERKFIKTVREAGATPWEIKEKISGFYRPTSNREMLKKAKARVDKDYNAALKDFEDFNMKPEEVVPLGEALAQKAIKENRNDDALKILEETAIKLTSLGRGVQSAKIWSNLTPSGMLRFAQKEVKKASESLPELEKFVKKKLKVPLPELTEEMAKEITDKMTKIQLMPDGVEKDNATLEVLEIINKQIPPSVSELFDAYRYQNMLSGWGTQLRNIYGNFFQTSTTRPIDLVSTGVVDWVKAGLSGKERENYISDVLPYYKNVLNSFPNAVEAFKKIMKGKTDLKKPEFQALKLKTKRLPKSLTIVARSMEAQDRFFSTLIASGEYARLRSSGAKESAARAGANKLAEKYLFREKLDPKDKDNSLFVRALDGLGTLVVQARRIPVIGKPLSWFQPFIQTATNIGKANIERTPLGLIGGKHDSEQIGKVLGGAIVMLLGAKLAMEGRTTFAPPINKDQRTLFYDSGKKPYSIKIGDTYVPAWYFGPYGLSLMIPAAYKYYSDESDMNLDDSQIKKLAKTIMGSARFLSSQTSLAGTSAFLRMLEGDVDWKVENILGFTAGQVIPLEGLVRSIAQVLDPVYRKSESFSDAIIKDIPVFSKQIEPIRTFTGEPVKKEWFDAFLPYAIGTEKEISEKAQELSNIKTKATHLKKTRTQILENIITGNEEGAASMIKSSGIELTNKEVNNYVKNEVISLIVGGKENEAKELIDRFKISVTQKEVEEAKDIALRIYESLPKSTRGAFREWYEKFKSEDEVMGVEEAAPSGIRVAPTPQPTVRIAPPTRQEITPDTGIQETGRYIIDDILEGL